MDKTHKPSSIMCATCQKENQDCSRLPFHEMKAIGADNAVIVVKCSAYRTTPESRYYGSIDRRD